MTIVYKESNKNMSNLNKIFSNVSRVLVGIVFIFSGFTKGLDPLGSAYKFGEYFNAVNLHHMGDLLLYLSILQSMAEFLIGIALLLRLIIRFTSWVTLLFMIFFTTLTLILAIFNPVSDCGCFGDAIKLTNWQTFFKNLILLPIVIYIFYNRKTYQNRNSIILQWVIVSVTAILFVGLSVFCYKHLPVVDFMPYSMGTYIPDKMKIPVTATRDKYETKLYYIKKGQVKEFSVDNYPWQDTTWRWVKTKTNLVKKGYIPPIHDFSITSPNGANLTDLILADTSYSFLFISHNLKEANQQSLQTAEKLASYCNKTGICKFYALTASPSSEVENLKKKFGLTLIFYSSDETTLKTIIRSNPGLLLLKNGIILGKWHYNDFSKLILNNGNFLSETITDTRKQLEYYKAFAFFVSLALIFCFIFLVAYRFHNKETKI
jgi:uncharacterized membrane protein YphA (DoxX/SURF4 family)